MFTLANVIIHHCNTLHPAILLLNKLQFDFISYFDINISKPHAILTHQPDLNADFVFYVDGLSLQLAVGTPFTAYASVDDFGVVESYK